MTTTTRGIDRGLNGKEVSTRNPTVAGAGPLPHREETAETGTGIVTDAGVEAIQAGPDPALGRHPETIVDLGQTRQDLGTKTIDVTEVTGTDPQAEQKVGARTNGNSYNNSRGAFPH